ncbi:hypothetical protein ACFZB9_24725 [Kitasatospora sp. NPDC008050]
MSTPPPITLHRRRTDSSSALRDQHPCCRQNDTSWTNTIRDDGRPTA